MTQLFYMEPSSSYITTIFIFAAIAIAGNGIIAWVLWHHYNVRILSTALIFFLHLSLIGQLIANLPVIYVGNWFICDLMGFLHFYFGLLNTLVTVLLTLSYYNIVQDNTFECDQRIAVRGLKVAFIFPLITILPFSQSKYAAISQWCTLDTSHDSALWAIFTFYIWILLSLFICCSLFGYIVYRASVYKSGIRNRLFRSLGAYILVTILCLLPRAIPRLAILLMGSSVDDDNPRTSGYEFAFEIPLYIAGLGYIIIFLMNYRTIKAYETHRHRDHSKISEVVLTLDDLEEVIKSALHEEMKESNQFEMADKDRVELPEMNSQA